MTFGRSLELFFVDGRPEGMLTAEVFNWTGHVLRIPELSLTEGLKRDEAKQTGVYILIGADDTGPLAYIGEAENLAERIKQHASSKKWWTQVVLVTTAGDALHKAHVKYLESRLVEEAQSVGHMRLENGNTPQRASLNEAARANMEAFLDTLKMVLSAIRVDLFYSETRRLPIQAPQAKIEERLFEFEVRKHGIKAQARLAAGEMIVMKGSNSRASWVGDRKHNTHYWKLHDKLVEDGVLIIKGDIATFTEDFAFSSPSAAAAIVAGRSSNGRTSWKLSDGRTYAEWEEQELESTSS